MCQFGLLKLVDAITLLAASGDDLVDAEDAVVEEVRDPPLLIPRDIDDPEVHYVLGGNSLKSSDALERGDSFLEEMSRTYRVADPSGVHPRPRAEDVQLGRARAHALCQHCSAGLEGWGDFGDKHVVSMEARISSCYSFLWSSTSVISPCVMPNGLQWIELNVLVEPSDVEFWSRRVQFCEPIQGDRNHRASPSIHCWIWDSRSLISAAISATGRGGV